MSLTKDQQTALNADLPSNVIAQRDGGGGKKLSYVQAWWVIDRLNAILGSGGWSYAATVVVCVPSKEVPGERGPRFAVTYRGDCTLRVGDCTITDVGFGQGLDKDEGAAHEKAGKEAASDALKRCAKSLGRHLGLALYDKTQEHVTDPALLAAIEKARTDIHAAKTLDGLKAVWTAIVKELEPFITPEVYTELESRKDASKERLGNASRSLPPKS